MPSRIVAPQEAAIALALLMGLTAA